MEDAMILNKASYERGFAHGTIYKTEVHFVFNCCVVFYFVPMNRELESKI